MTFSGFISKTLSNHYFPRICLERPTVITHVFRQMRDSGPRIKPRSSRIRSGRGKHSTRHPVQSCPYFRITSRVHVIPAVQISRGTERTK